MIEQALEFLKKQAVSAAKAEIRHLPGDPEHLYRVLHPDGDVTGLELDPPVRRLAVLRLEDLIAMAAEPFDQAMSDPGRRAVFYDHQQVELVFDTRDGRERATLMLHWSDQADFFARRRDKPTISVRDLRFALRITLEECFDNPHLIKQVSAIDFRNTDAGGATIDRGKESLGRTIHQEINAVEGMPDETQMFELSLWADPDLVFKLPLRCKLDPLVQERAWFLKPVDRSWESFQRESLEHLRSKLVTGLKDKGVKVYEGRFDGGEVVNVPATDELDR
jgi:hypothetical protein